MKKLVMFFGLMLALMIFPLVNAQSASLCDLSVSLLNQDPYPAIPGEYVKVVFQLKGLDEPTCGQVNFELVEEFPFTLEPGQKRVVEFGSGTFVKDYKSYGLIPYTIIVDERALDGDRPINVKYTSNAQRNNVTSITKQFNINVEDLRTDFEIHVKDYVASTNTLTFEILNVGEHDVEALTVEIPNQDNIQVKGSNRNIVGSLDSDEDTSFSFEAVPSDGEITLNILYNDEINERRQVSKAVTYDPSYFEGRVRDQKPSNTGYYILAGIIIVVILFWWRRRANRRKKNHMSKK